MRPTDNGSRVLRFVEPDVDPAWRDPVLVVCPRCADRAVVRGSGGAPARLVCAACGLVRDWDWDELHVLVGGRRKVLTFGGYTWVDPATGRPPPGMQAEEAVDARFGTPLLLQATCCGGRLLWANNETHLEYLTAYVSGRLRERRPGPAPLSAKLPAWLKAAKNRDEVLRHLDRFRRLLDAAPAPTAARQES